MSLAQRLLAETERAQGAASDPAASAWVSANAGAGKTHVLKMRVLRLLLSGTAPERIMCLTYTKAAAAEMSSRIFTDLAAWATATEADLHDALKKLLGRDPGAAEQERARRLFAAAIETPGGLKVQTIHAFCERLLQRFPLEAGVPPGFKILDDELARTLRNEAIEATLMEATREARSTLGTALALVVRFASSDGFDELLTAALARPEWLQQMADLDLRDFDAEDFAGADQLYRKLLGLDPDDERSVVEEQLAGLVTRTDLERLCSVLGNGGGKKDGNTAELARAVLAAPNPGLRIEALNALLITGKGTPRKDLMTKPLATEHPDLDAQFKRITDDFLLLDGKRRSLVLLEATLALLRLSGDVQQRFAAAKAQRAALDFDDLIRATARLLGNAADTAWVLFKLDGGIEHILVDEAQDTSPLQWAIVEALAGEFFVGEGSADRPRTLFAVGDEKQSIYSFQGAAPKMFAATGDRFAATCADAGIEWRRVPLQLSFRTVVPLLEAVDTIFRDSARGRGVVMVEGSLRHVALRQGQAGLIEVWPVERAEDAEIADPWSPLGDSVAMPPASRVANRVADTIARWLADGETLTSQDRPINAGDIVILVRSRRPFAGAMVAALKARDIPVAGADRMHLTDEIAVRDLIALGDFLTLPEDDLALATVLKSPLFDLDDDDLMAVAPARKGALWSAVIDRAKSDVRFKPAAEQLRRWRADADYLPPFEFFAKILDSDGMRARLLRRLGPDAVDPIDELVNRAIAYDDQSPPSMQGFLTWLRSGVHEIKRDMEQTRREVRVMTVHGAKGLEAPIVFLPDTCGAPSKGRDKLVAIGEGIARPSGIDAPLAWPVKGANRIAAVADGKAAAKSAEEEEHRRLLYVALTRPRDRLYVAGYEGKKRRPTGCWYDLVTQGLADLLVEHVETDGRKVLRYESRQDAPHDPRRDAAIEADAPVPPPDWAHRPAPREASLVVPMAPSRLAPLDTDDTGEPIEIADAPKPVTAVADLGSPSPLVLAGGDRFLRGTLTHALLQHLPELPPSAWERAAKAFIEQRGRSLGSRARASVVAETLAVLRDPAFAAVFGPGSQAEVPIVGELDNPVGRGPRLRINGQIDRLVDTGAEVLLIDYKTNRPPPLEVEGIPRAYLYQMAAYRLVLGQIFPDRPVRAAILWTDGPRLMPIPDHIIEAEAGMLWKLDSGRLDG